MRVKAHHLGPLLRKVEDKSERWKTKAKGDKSERWKFEKF